MGGFDAPRLTPRRGAAAPSLFARVLVGVDGSLESREAARQAALLADPTGRLTVLAAYDIAPTQVGGTGSKVPVYFDEEAQRRSAEQALADVRDEFANLRPPSGKVVRGWAWQELVREAEREGSTLIVVGSHGVGQLRGILVGSTATEVIHKAPCSVLVARAAEQRLPQRIVVGVDGSPESAVAYAAARELAERFGASLLPVVAHGGKGVDRAAVAAIVGHQRKDLPDEPVQALFTASAEADLVIVGGRGLHGLKSLGSVSERVAHQARRSTLIVREPRSNKIGESGTTATPS
jgi:nucleotide-binding universal stress UspA family protein